TRQANAAIRMRADQRIRSQSGQSTPSRSADDRRARILFSSAPFIARILTHSVHSNTKDTLTVSLICIHMPIWVFISFPDPPRPPTLNVAALQSQTKIGPNENRRANEASTKREPDHKSLPKRSIVAALRVHYHGFSANAAARYLFVIS